MLIVLASVSIQLAKLCGLIILYILKCIHLYSFHLLASPSNMPRASPRLYLGVAHTGGSDEGLLDGVAFGEGGLLLGLRRVLRRPAAPVALDEELHHLHVAPEGGVHQRALPVPVQVVHLEAHQTVGESS